MPPKDQIDVNPSPYHQIWEILLNTTRAIKDQGIPLEDIPIAAAEWLMVSILALEMDERAATREALSIIEYQLDILDDVLEGKPPFKHTKTTFQH